MSESTLTKLDGGQVSIGGESLDSFKASLSGELLLSNDEGYDEARTIWNAMIDRKPGMIVRCNGSDDVISAVNFAREHNVLLSIKGAGHNIAGNAVCDGGLMIDLSGMKEIRVDTEKKRAYVGPGCTLGDFDEATQAHGLATPVGINSTTGIAGLTLGGGFGWLTRKYGLTLDNLVSADVVTTQGELVHVSGEEHSDLFWAIRGGGGNFGIVTMFEFALHEVGPELLAGLVVFPFEEARQVLEKYREFTMNAPEELTVWLVMRQAPPLPFLPEEVHGKEVVVFAMLYCGGIEEGQRLVEPIQGFGNPHGVHIGPMPYTAWQQAFDPLLTPGARNYWKSHNFSELSDGAFDAMIEFAGKLPGPQCEIFIAHIEGYANRVPMDATSYSQRDAKYVLNVHGRWDDPSEDQAVISWAREFFDKSAPHATGGVYINFMTEEESDRVTNAYGSNHERLVDLKYKYDPLNLLRMNQNIKPGG